LLSSKFEMNSDYISVINPWNKRLNDCPIRLLCSYTANLILAKNNSHLSCQVRHFSHFVLHLFCDKLANPLLSPVKLLKEGQVRDFKVHRDILRKEEINMSGEVRSRKNRGNNKNKNKSQQQQSKFSIRTN